jgi:hypothetical protein
MRRQILFSYFNPEPIGTGSVADRGCLSRIPDPKIATNERGEKKLVKKKIWANSQRIIELSTQKIVIKLSKV